MTYNFDPDRWLEDQRRLVDAKRQRGELSDEEYAARLAALEERYDRMLQRLDGTFGVGRREPESGSRKS